MRKLPYILIILIVLFIALGLTACRTEPVSFSAAVNGSLVEWEAVSGASRYTLTCTTPDGSGYTISLEKTSFLAPQSATGDFLYRIKAYAADGTLLGVSDEVLCHLGKGGHLDPILISNADDLKSLTTGTVSVSFGSTKVSAPLYYKLTQDIDLTGVSFTPIGNSSKPFAGYFDGDGHTISNLTFTKTNTDGRIGLFGSINKGVVKNLVLEDATITMTSSSGASGSGLEYGILAAHTTDTLIDNCHVTGNITFLKNVTTTGSYTVDIGGLVGDVSGGKMFSSSFTGTIYAQYSRVNAGGLVGYATSGSQRFVMANCLANATVSAAATGYDESTQTSKAVARSGVLIGSILGADMITSSLAVGQANAVQKVDGTPPENITYGVFGATAGSSTVNTVPMRNVYYSADTIDVISGTRSNIGEGNTVRGLSSAEMILRDSYKDGDEATFDFDAIWDMGDPHPVLRGAGQTFIAEDIRLTVVDETSDARYAFSLYDTFIPLYYSLTIGRVTRYYNGYQLNSILTNIGVELTDGATAVVLSAKGVEDITLEVSRSGTIASTYLMYGSYGAYSKVPSLYENVHVINAGASEEYDLPREITVTIKADTTVSE